MSGGTGRMCGAARRWRRRAKLLTAGRISLLAAAGVSQVRVGRQPVVGLLATGSELKEPGQPLAPGQIYESNRFALAALARRAGAIPRVFPLVADSLAATRRALADGFQPVRCRGDFGRRLGGRNGFRQARVSSKLAGNCNSGKWRSGRAGRLCLGAAGESSYLACPATRFLRWSPFSCWCVRRCCAGKGRGHFLAGAPGGVGRAAGQSGRAPAFYASQGGCGRKDSLGRRSSLPRSELAGRSQRTGRFAGRTAPWPREPPCRCCAGNDLKLKCPLRGGEGGRGRRHLAGSVFGNTGVRPRLAQSLRIHIRRSTRIELGIDDTHLRLESRARRGAQRRSADPSRRSPLVTHSSRPPSEGASALRTWPLAGGCQLESAWNDNPPCISYAPKIFSFDSGVPEAENIGEGCRAPGLGRTRSSPVSASRNFLSACSRSLSPMGRLNRPARTASSRGSIAGRPEQARRSWIEAGRPAQRAWHQGARSIAQQRQAPSSPGRPARFGRLKISSAVGPLNRSSGFMKTQFLRRSSNSFTRLLG